jgi:hypothetical protein
MERGAGFETQFDRPPPPESWARLGERAAIGPVSGQLPIAVGLVFHSAWISVALLTLRGNVRSDGPRGRSTTRC